MAGWIVGSALIVVGLAGASTTLRFVLFTARLFPREITRGDVGNLVAESFILRFISLLLVTAGLALILLETLPA